MPTVLREVDILGRVILVPSKVVEGITATEETVHQQDLLEIFSLITLLSLF